MCDGGRRDELRCTCFLDHSLQSLGTPLRLLGRRLIRVPPALPGNTEVVCVGPKAVPSEEKVETFAIVGRGPGISSLKALVFAKVLRIATLIPGGLALRLRIEPLSMSSRRLDEAIRPK